MPGCLTRRLAGNPYLITDRLAEKQIGAEVQGNQAGPPAVRFIQGGCSAGQALSGFGVYEHTVWRFHSSCLLFACSGKPGGPRNGQ